MTNCSGIQPALRKFVFTIVALSMAALVNVTVFDADAFAADLQSAKATGQVGERRDGMLGIVNANAPADIKALVNSINAKRQAEYQRIAKKNNVSAAQVGKLTAEKVINAAPAGTFIQGANGKWVQK